jgi:hypothetical protein
MAGGSNAPIVAKVNTMKFSNNAAPDGSRPDEFIDESKFKAIAIGWPEKVKN